MACMASLSYQHIKSNPQILPNLISSWNKSKLNISPWANPVIRSEMKLKIKQKEHQADMHPAASSRSQRGNLGPAAEGCQQAVTEAEC